MIRGALQFRKAVNASDPMKEIVKRVTNALERIGGESNINARRVNKTYGISVKRQTGETSPSNKTD